jgi:hypothetical protein
MREMMQRLENECVMRTAVARDNFAQFCELNGISITDRPQFKGSVSASWREEIGEADYRLMFCTRHYDLVILGRPTGPNGLQPDLLERLLLGSGRPLLIAPPRVSEQLLGTVMVCWKETAEAARAVGAANAAPGQSGTRHSRMASAPRSNSCRRPPVRRARC